MSDMGFEGMPIDRVDLDEKSKTVRLIATNDEVREAAEPFLEAAGQSLSLETIAECGRVGCGAEAQRVDTDLGQGITSSAIGIVCTRRYRECPLRLTPTIDPGLN